VTVIRNCDNLTPKQERVALLIASGHKQSDAARSAGVGERTVKTWAAEVPAFARRVNELRAHMTDAALGRLTDGMTTAADTLGYLARRGKSESVRLSASKALIELCCRLRETTELERRLAALEAAQAGFGRPRGVA
jgi:hypothetical protein